MGKENECNVVKINIGESSQSNDVCLNGIYAGVFHT